MKNHNQKHLTLSDRFYIEQELQQGHSFSSIAKTLNKDPSTISKEVKRNRIYCSPDRFQSKCKSCMNYADCKEHHVCGNRNCNGICRQCRGKNPISYCIHFQPWVCNKTDKPPYVCNACTLEQRCKLAQYHYLAKKAQAKYEKTLSKSREGINMTPEELQELNDLISPLILKGQPLSHIFAVHADEIPVCRRTLYNYLDQKVF